MCIPETVKVEDVVYSLPFDINEKAEQVNGYCVIYEHSVSVWMDDRIYEEFKLTNYEEYECIQMQGCCMLVGKSGQSVHKICSFTHTWFVRYAELCKLLNHYVRTGELVEQNGEDEPNCSSCGLPLDGAKECPFCAEKTTNLLRLLQRTLPYKKLLIVSIVATILANVVFVVLPYIQKVIIDEYITNGNTMDRRFVLCCIAIISMLGINWFLEYINLKASATVALCFGRDLRNELFEKTQQLSMSAIAKRTPGDLINRVNHDAQRLQDFVTANGKDAMVKLFSVVLLTVLLFYMDPSLAWMVLLPMPLVLFVVRKLYRMMHLRYARVWRLRAKYSSLLHDILYGIREVKTYGNETREIQRYENASEEWMKSSVAAEVVWNLTVPLAQFILTIGTYFVLYFGGTMVLKQELTLGELVQYTTYVSMLYEPLTWLMNIPRLLADTTVSAARVFEIIDDVEDIADKDNAVRIPMRGSISFENVSFGYQVYHPVLKSINCNIQAGEMIGIVGHSGTGKSTFINLLMRLYECTEGCIKIDGIDIRDIAQESLRSQVGVVLQETFLFEGSIYENISYSKPDASIEEVIEAAKIANAHDFIVKLPEGYHTKVGSKGHSLSGGERQRIAIARAILHNPKILILDEATASLDTQTEKQIQEALDRLTKGRTTIAIAHRLSTLHNADRLLVLDKGQVAEMGTHEELMQIKGVYYKLVMAQRETAKLKQIAG